MNRPAIEVRDLSVKYPLRRRPALKGVSFDVAQGETLLILGPSGGGKSTLALTLNGLIPHNIEADVSGSVRVLGMEAFSTPPGMLSKHVGVVFQDPEAQFCTLTVADEVAFGLENLGVPRSEMDGRIRRALSMVGMEGMERRHVGDLSGGEKQRLALASVLVMEPEIIVLDEPTANLDPLSTVEFFRIVEPLRREHTILIVEHKLDECIHLVDRVLVLSHEGTVVAEGPPREIFSRRSSDLLRYGIWIPQVTEWALGLRSRGFAVPTLPLTVEEAVALARELRIGREEIAPAARKRWSIRGRPAAVEVRGLSYTYPRAEAPALKSASLEVPEGSLFALLGPNGSGKSTLAAHLISIRTPPPRKVFVFGADVAETPLERLTEMVGYVFQNPEHQFVTDSVYDELAYSLRVRGWRESEIAPKVESVLRDFHLEHLAKANPFTLSQGQKRRLSVATMLVVGQRLLVLDEPTFGQDRLTTERMIARWKALQAKGVTVLFITHDMRLVLEVAEQVAVLSNGSTIYQGAVERLYSEESLLREAHIVPPPLYRVAMALGRSWRSFGGRRSL